MIESVPGLYLALMSVVHRLLASTLTVAIQYHSAQKLMLILSFHGRREDWFDLGSAVRVCSQCPRLYIAVIFVTKLPTLGFDPGISCTTFGHVSTRSLQSVSTDNYASYWSLSIYCVCDAVWFQRPQLPTHCDPERRPRGRSVSSVGVCQHKLSCSWLHTDGATSPGCCQRQRNDCPQSG